MESQVLQQMTSLERKIDVMSGKFSDFSEQRSCATCVSRRSSSSNLVSDLSAVLPSSEYLHKLALAAAATEALVLEKLAKIELLHRNFDSRFDRIETALEQKRSPNDNRMPIFETQLQNHVGAQGGLENLLEHPESV